MRNEIDFPGGLQYRTPINALGGGSRIFGHFDDSVQSNLCLPSSTAYPSVRIQASHKHPTQSSRSTTFTGDGTQYLWICCCSAFLFLFLQGRFILFYRISTLHGRPMVHNGLLSLRSLGCCARRICGVILVVGHLADLIV